MLGRDLTFNITKFDAKTNRLKNSTIKTAYVLYNFLSMHSIYLCNIIINDEINERSKICTDSNGFVITTCYKI